LVLLELVRFFLQQAEPFQLRAPFFVNGTQLQRITVNPEASEMFRLRSEPKLPKKLVPLYRRRVVAIHPGSGNELKIWPLAH